MSKKQKAKKQRNEEGRSNAASGKIILQKKQLLQQARFHYFLIALITLVVFGNTIKNEFALDDAMYITQNKFTQQGTEGIHDLFTKESLVGFVGEDSKITGGRWRPLALITFAMEYQYFSNPADGNISMAHIMHFDNLLLYVVSCLLLLFFLRRYVFRFSPMYALAATLLFVVHPIHTEVAANIKSRDELMAFLFLMLTLIFAMKFSENQKKYLLLFLALFSYFLSLLSKETGLVFLAVIPLSFYFFGKFSFKKIVMLSLPYAVLVAFYILLRLQFVSFKNNNLTDVMNAPFALATTSQHYATVIMNLLTYIKLLFIPYPLSFDYSYNQIPYVGFADWRVLLSIVVHVCLVVVAMFLVKKKNIFVYAISIYLVNIFIVSNLLIDTGGTIAERFLFVPSIGFCIIIIEVARKVLQKKSVSKNIFQTAQLCFLAILILFSFISFSRNAEWKNDKTLYTTDVVKVPNSARANNAACGAYSQLAMDEKDEQKQKALYEKAISYGQKAVSIVPGFADAWGNLGVPYFNMKNYKMADSIWAEEKKVGPNQPNLINSYLPLLADYFKTQGSVYEGKQNFDSAIYFFKKSIIANPRKIDVPVLFELSGIYYNRNQFDSSYVYANRALYYSPNDAKLNDLLNALAHQGYPKN